MALANWATQALIALGFDFAGIQWDEIAHVAVMNGLAYFGKNLVGTSYCDRVGISGALPQ